MNLAEAQKLANEEAPKEVADTKVKCRALRKTGLLVIVYWSNYKECDVIPKATVLVKEEKPTDNRGIAMWKPLSPSILRSYTIKLVKLPHPENLYEKPAVKSEWAYWGKTSICELGVKALAQPTIRVIQRKGNGEQALKDVSVVLHGAKRYDFPLTTDNQGLTKWPDDKTGIEPGPYTVGFGFPRDGTDPRPYYVVNKDDKPVDSSPLDLPPLSTETFPFYVRRRSWVKFRVVYAGTDKNVPRAQFRAKLVGGTLTPDNEDTSLAGVYSIKNIPNLDCLIESIETDERLIFEAIEPKC